MVLFYQRKEKKCPDEFFSYISPGVREKKDS